MANEKRLIDLDEAIDALGVEYEDIKCKHFLEECPNRGCRGSGAV